MERFKRVDFEGFCFVLPGETFEEIEPSTEDRPRPRVCSDWVHSSDFGITRVSDGSRYNDITSPPFQDKTYQAPGRDGAYYFESFYNARQIQVSFAFDHMSETQLRALRKRFDGKNMGELIFDEYPFKAYTVKLQQPLQVKYVCFDEEVGVREDEVTPIFERVYKGEGTINFICYDPFARAVHPYLSQYDEFNYPNIGEWAEASGLEAGPQDFTDKKLVLYNNGDYPAEYKIYIPFELMSEPLTLRISAGDESLYILQLGAITTKLSTNDEFILIDMERHLIKGANFERVPTGTIYNSYIISGDFGNLPISDGREIKVEIIGNRTNGWILPTKQPTNRVIFMTEASLSSAQNYDGDTFGFGYGPFENTSNEWVFKGGSTLSVASNSVVFSTPTEFYFNKNDYPAEAAFGTDVTSYFTFFKNRGRGSGTDYWISVFCTPSSDTATLSSNDRVIKATPFLCDQQISLYENVQNSAISPEIQLNTTYVIYISSTSTGVPSATIPAWDTEVGNILSADDVTSTFKLDYRYF